MAMSAPILAGAFKRRSLRRLTQQLRIPPYLPIALVLGEVRAVQVFGNFPKLGLNLVARTGRPARRSTALVDAVSERPPCYACYGLANPPQKR